MIVDGGISTGFMQTKNSEPTNKFYKLYFKSNEIDVG